MRVGALCAALVPAAAGADSHRGDPPRPTGSVAFRLDASNGFELLVIAASTRADGAGRIALIAGDRTSSVVYSAPANVTTTSLRADLGALGSVDLKLVAKHFEKTEEVGCTKPLHFEAAAYEGTFEFHGEEGYTEAVASSIPFAPGFFVRWICGGGVGYGDSSGPGLPGARLRVRAPGQRDPLVEVKKNRPEARTSIAVAVHEEEEDIAVDRTTSMIVGPGAFSYDPELRTATVDPPAPFSGTATYRAAAPVGRRWSGSLEVDLPGASHTPLTGPGLRASIVHAHWSQSR